MEIFNEDLMVLNYVKKIFFFIGNFGKFFLLLCDSK